MEVFKKHIKDNYHYIVSALAVVGIAFVAFNSPPLFNSLDNFVLFAQEEIQLEQGVQISSGDLGSNDEIDIQKDTIISGNLFTDEIAIDKNTTINGNVSFNKLKLHKEAKILGIQTKPIQLPIAKLPEIPDFQIGTKDFKFTGQNNTLASGNYRDIILEKDSRLTLTGGIYNLRKLELKENSVLIFNSSTIINIQFKLKGQKHVSILSGNNNLKPTDLAVNYVGIRPKNEKVEKEDDDEEIEGLLNDNKKKEQKEQKIGRPIVFGKDSFLNFKLLAPKASVKLGETSTIRGQILARKVKIEKGTVVSREMNFEKESDLTRIVTDNGIKFIANEIVIVFSDEITITDIQNIIELVSGNIIGFAPNPPIYKIELITNTANDLNNAVQAIKNLNNPHVLEVMPNLISK